MEGGRVYLGAKCTKGGYIIFEFVDSVVGEQTISINLVLKPT